MIIEFEPKPSEGNRRQWPFRKMFIGDVVYIRNPQEWQRARGAAHITGIDTQKKFKGRMDKKNGIMTIERIK